MRKKGLSFLKGRIFSQRINLFNSRRIGKRPNFYIPDEGEINGLSNYTTILGATKIMGVQHPILIMGL